MGDVRAVVADILSFSDDALSDDSAQDGVNDELTGKVLQALDSCRTAEQAAQS